LLPSVGCDFSKQFHFKVHSLSAATKQLGDLHMYSLQPGCSRLTAKKQLGLDICSHSCILKPKYSISAATKLSMQLKRSIFTASSQNTVNSQPIHSQILAAGLVRDVIITVTFA
jgi:hypothetical protein